MKISIILYFILAIYSKNLYSQQIFIEKIIYDSSNYKNKYSEHIYYSFNKDNHVIVNIFLYNDTTKKYITEFQQSSIYNNKNFQIIEYYPDNRIKRIYTSDNDFYTNDYISFHNNGYVDSIGTFQKYDSTFEARQKCDTIIEPYNTYLKCQEILYQDKEWLYYDNFGKLIKTRMFDKGILIRENIVNY